MIGFASRFIAGAAAPVAPMRSYRGRRVSREPSQITVANWSLDVARALSAPERISLRVQGWPERTLERLLPFADKVERLIIEAAIPDLSGLSSFDSLKELSISGPVEAIDFSALRRLEILRLSGQIEIKSHGVGLVYIYGAENIQAEGNGRRENLSGGA